MLYNPGSIRMFDVGGLVVSHDDEQDLWAVNFQTERLYSLRDAFDGSGARFTNGFSIAIQIRWKLRFALISIPIQWSLQNFVHGTTTAVLSWYVQKFVAI